MTTETTAPGRTYRHREGEVTPLKLDHKPLHKGKKGVHPLIWCMETRLNGRPKAALADLMGVRPQSLYKWLAYCRLDRNFSLPAERAVQIAQFFDVKPSMFRPDVFQ